MASSAPKPSISPEWASIAASVAIAVMVVVGLAIDNPDEVNLVQSVRPLIGLMAFAIVFPALCFRLGALGRAIGFSFPIVFFFFFKFEVMLSVALALLPPGDHSVWVALCLYGALAVLITVVIAQRGGEKISNGLFFVAVAAALGSCFMLGIQNIATAPRTSDGRDQVLEAALTKETTPLEISAIEKEALPDIIYIVPDRYGDEATLSAVYNVDVETFRGALEEREFFMANAPRSNYAKTFQSLASSMNMTTLDTMLPLLEKSSNDRRPLFRMIRDNRVQATLKQMGYEFIHLGSWWEPTRINRNADINYYGSQNFSARFSEFERALLALTPLEWAGSRDECQRLKSQLSYLKTARAKSDKPVFVFAHLTLPHPPITMDREGNCIPHISYAAMPAVSWEENRNAFRDYVEFANQSFLDIFDANMENDSRDFIFAIQSDEGPYPKSLQRNDGQDMHAMADHDIKTKFGIINALYWDKDRFGAPYLTETPINNWRIILSAITGEAIPLAIDERSELMRSETDVYDMRDVTSLWNESDDEALVARK